jgi:fatty-acyl-CoA synthase
VALSVTVGYGDLVAQPETLTGPPLTGAAALTLREMLVDRAEQFHDHEALVFDDPFLDGAVVRWSYDDLLDHARRIAKALLASGIGKGGRVGVLMGNRPEAVASLFGITLAGGVAVPLSTFSTHPELAFLLRHADVGVLLAQTTMGARDFAGDLAAVCPAAAGAEPIRDTALPHLRRVAALGPADEHGGLRPWRSFLEDGESIDDALLDAVTDDVHPSDPAVIVYSSGTTDRPKGVVHHHEAIARQWWTQAALFGRDATTRVWCPLPLFWTAGLTAALGATLAAGATWVMQERFEAGHALRLLEREQVTEPHVFGHHARALEEHPDWTATDLSSCSKVFGKSVFTRHPTVVGDPTWNMPIGYGTSETASFFTALPATTPRAGFRNGSYGRLLPGNELRVIDPATGAVLGSGAEGELIVRGPTLMAGYLKRTRGETFDADGWYHTGDLGSYDSDGHVYFSGRRTEMIKTAGANVSPAEIDVQMQAYEPAKLTRAIGVPDERRDEIPVLCVALKDGATVSEDDVRSFLRTRLASYKVPRRVLFMTEEEIPMTRSGTKVHDDGLLAIVLERLGR